MASFRGKDNLIRRFESYVGQVGSWEELDSFLSLSPRPPKYGRYRQFIVYHRGPLPVLLTKRLSWWYPQLKPINDQVDAYRLSFEFGRNQIRSASGVFVVKPGNQEHLHRIMTISHSTLWNKGIRRAVKKLYPEAIPVFFKQEEIKEALLSLQRGLDPKTRILISDVTMKRKAYEQSSKRSRGIETDRRWTELTIEEAFDDAKEAGYWFTSVKFEIERRSRNRDSYERVAQGRIYKHGAINYDFLHSEIDETVVSALEYNASVRMRFLSNRGIRARKYEPAKPIQITYHRNIFNDPSEVKRFGSAISTYPKSTRAVFHANPYYHASIADFEDGSSFEVWILSPRRVLIAPQAKCTEKALERVISHIFTQFNEGDLGEFES